MAAEHIAAGGAVGNGEMCVARPHRKTDEARRVDLIVETHAAPGRGRADTSAANGRVAGERLHAAEARGPAAPRARLIGRCPRLQRLERGRRRLLGGVGERCRAGRRRAERDAVAVGGRAAAPERALVHQHRAEHGAARERGVLRRAGALTRELGERIRRAGHQQVAVERGGRARERRRVGAFKGVADRLLVRVQSRHGAEWGSRQRHIDGGGGVGWSGERKKRRTAARI